MHQTLQTNYLRRMRAMPFALSFLTLCTAAHPQAPHRDVTITRDTWGIAHIHGHTDADAVFGMIYAQCEDDFHRVERNYLTALGRTAEADGEQALWADLRQRLFLSPADLQRDYKNSPPWLRALMDSWAQAINFYLSKHPEVHPQVLAHWEPWMALSFTEGSIGGDIERIDLVKLRAYYFYSTPTSTHLSSTAAPTRPDWQEPEPRGSNGIAIAPSNTRDGHALLLINPHTSFFFRAEQQVTSDEGLNAYGAATWGQFFIYQGFNDRAGWMHTSSGVDAVDEYVETLTPRVPHVVPKGNVGTIPPQYTQYGPNRRPILTKPITLTYTTPAGLKTRTILAQYSTHGPLIRSEDGHPVAIKLMNLPVSALEQSFLRTKARTYAEYAKTMALQANSSNNTLFASAAGDIAYWHGNFIPRRDPRFDYTQPVDGTNPATDWQGLLRPDETPQLHNPASGYVFNVNDSPWNGAGPSSLRKQDYPAYVEQGIESARGLHAIRVLEGHKDFTLESLQGAAYDHYLPWFARTIPILLEAWQYPLSVRDRQLREGPLKDQLTLLRDWDRCWSEDSEATTVAVFWGTELMKTAGPAARALGIPSEEYVATKMTGNQLVAALEAAVKKLTADFGDWGVEWGKVNRFQRLNDAITPTFSDASPSIPVPFPSALWGSLASFGARQYPNTKDWYGTSGNSFVAVVEFGPRIRALAVTAGGESGNPASLHFNDQAQRYARGQLREVYFYPDQLKTHTERTYRPGEER